MPAEATSGKFNLFHVTGEPLLHGGPYGLLLSVSCMFRAIHYTPLCYVQCVIDRGQVPIRLL